MEAKETWNKIRECLGDEIKLSKYTSFAVKNNMRRLVYCLSRYKFVSKLLQGKNSLLELGCNDGFYTMVFKDVVQNITGIDFDEDSIKYASETLAENNIKFILSDIFCIEKLGSFDAVVSMDVIEHIEKHQEDDFLKIMCMNLNEHGIGIVGTPNITASEYASDESKIGHINLYDHTGLYNLMNKYFHNTFIFSANDETVHTGFYPMAHYFIAVGITKRG